MGPIRRERMTAVMEGDFVIFVIGLRLNQPLMIHRWLPVLRAMPSMLRELYRQPELGFIHSEMWFARTVLMLQYWRSMDQLLAYARNKDAAHLPAWRSFNEAAGRSASVGIWHETYAASAGSYENVYVNMPAFGLGKAGSLVPATGARKSAADRLRATREPPRPM